MNPWQSLARCLSCTVIVLLAGCASSTDRGAHAAIRDLDAGYCPTDIIYSAGQPPASGHRYGDASYAQLATYRDRELANCWSALRQGKPEALHTLLRYWRAQGDGQQEANTYRTYIEHGADRQLLVEASTTLYRLYARGAPGLAPDQDLAFNYLGKAVSYGVTGLRLPYANALFDRGLYRDAGRYYLEFAGSDPRLTDRASACEANLRLAEMHFRGLGKEENWYLGYYFWQRGLTLAEGARWGSCHRDNFVYGARYTYEKERKALADSRIDALQPLEVRELQRALAQDWDSGLLTVSALSFRLAGRSAAPVAAPPAATTPGGWPDWAPLRAPICALSGSSRPLNWADLFELRASSIWIVRSHNGSTTSRGSAVAVGPHSLLSNCHLIYQPGGIELLQGTQKLGARVTAADRRGDRCVLTVDQPLAAYVGTATPFATLRVGADVAAIGNPRGLDTSLSRGIIAQKRSGATLSLIQTDTTLAIGSSGGGLFDQAGNLIGITTFQVGEGEDLNFAIAVDEFCR